MRYVKVNVQGQVQGVGFRYFTQNIAIECDIVGWVKNEDDGSVHIEAQGDEANISKFLDKVEKGPSRFARVKKMNVTDLKGDPQYKKFDVKY